MSPPQATRPSSTGRLLALLAWLVIAGPPCAVAQPAPARNVDVDARASGRAALARLPLSFEAREAGRFLARGDGYRVFVNGAGAVLVFRESE